MRTRPVPNCRLCGDPGRVIYPQMPDRSLTTAQRWDWRKCQAADCGLVWLDPVPVEEDIGEAYQGYYTHSQPEPGSQLLRRICWGIWHSYLGVRFGYTRGTGPKWARLFAPLALLHPGGRAELDAAAMYLPAPRQLARREPRPAVEPSRLLDVGCGSGVVLARMQSFGWEVEGVEPDPMAAEAARAKGVPVRVGTLEPQGFPANHFDAVHSAHVLEHVHDPLRLLQESFRILKPGGMLVTITPNAESWGHRRFGSAWLMLDPPRHLALFSRVTLRRAAEKAGFRVERLRTTVRNAWVYGALTQCIRRTGRNDMSELGRPAGLARGLAYQLRQRFALRDDAEAGDELLLVAIKPRSEQEQEQD